MEEDVRESAEVHKKLSTRTNVSVLYQYFSTLVLDLSIESIMILRKQRARLDDGKWINNVTPTNFIDTIPRR